MTSMARESEEMLRRIEAASMTADLDALVALGQELELIWRERDARLYGRLVLMLCRALGSYALGDVRRQHRLLARFAIAAAETPAALDVMGRAELLLLLPPPVAVGDLHAFWIEQRARAARVWIETEAALARAAAEQPALRARLASFRDAMSAFLERAYALPPDETDELKALLAGRAITNE